MTYAIINVNCNICELNMLPIKPFLMGLILKLAPKNFVPPSYFDNYSPSSVSQKFLRPKNPHRRQKFTVNFFVAAVANWPERAFFGDFDPSPSLSSCSFPTLPSVLCSVLIAFVPARWELLLLLLLWNPFRSSFCIFFETHSSLPPPFTSFSSLDNQSSFYLHFPFSLLHALILFFFFGRRNSISYFWWVALFRIYGHLTLMWWNLKNKNKNNFR